MIYQVPGEGIDLKTIACRKYFSLESQGTARGF